MASKKSIAIRVDVALTRIAGALGDSVRVRHKDPAIQQALQLEAIADAATAAAIAEALGALTPPDTATNDGVVDELPGDFPGRDELIAAGHTTIDAVRAVEDLTAITGIGKATAAAIAEALAALAPADTATNDGAAA